MQQWPNIQKRGNKMKNDECYISPGLKEKFRQEFADCDKESFSYEGEVALFDMIEQVAKETGAPIELDVIALWFHYTEYNNLAEIQEVYSCTRIPDLDHLREHTTVIEFDGGIIVKDF